MDIMIEVPRLPYEEIRTQIQQESSESIRNRVMQAREIQINRQSEAGFSHQLNASLSGKTLKSACILDQKGEELLEMAINRFHLTGRGINKILRVARTIADLNEKKQIEPRHVAEAIQFREKRWEDR
jgi:magnesium chelatase family protein